MAFHAGGSLLAKGACGSSLVPGTLGLAAGGSTTFAGGRKGGQPSAPISKASYALILDEQIAARNAQKAISGDVGEEIPFIKGAAATVERAMGQRHGGPMAKPCKEAYALELQEQIAARVDAKNALDKELIALLAEHESDGNFSTSFSTGATERRQGKRCGGPMLPESKESYALALQEQIDIRNCQKANDMSLPEKSIDIGKDALDDITLGKGRRHLVPLAGFSKESYAADLREQMAEKNARRAENRAQSLEPLEMDKVTLDTLPFMRGRRHETKIAKTSKPSYNLALQDQMAEKAAKKAADAFHVQRTTEVPHVSNASLEAPTRGRRLGGPMLPDSKESYASALQQQIRERDSRLAELHSADAISGIPFTGYTASVDIMPGKGRRHQGQMSSMSKQALAATLQDQMAMKDEQRRVNAFHSQAPASIESSKGCLPRMHDPELGQSVLKGRYHGGPMQPLSKQSYAKTLLDQIDERDEHRTVDGLPFPAHADALEKLLASQ